MVKLRLKIGLKGQIIVPKFLRDKYGIKEGGYITVEVREDELAIKGFMDIDEALKWIRERRSRITGREARLGDLVNIDLEEEFNNESIHRCKYTHISEC